MCITTDFFLPLSLYAPPKYIPLSHTNSFTLVFNKYEKAHFGCSVFRIRHSIQQFKDFPFLNSLSNCVSCMINHLLILVKIR